MCVKTLVVVSSLWLGVVVVVAVAFTGITEATPRLVMNLLLEYNMAHHVLHLALETLQEVSSETLTFVVTSQGF